MRALLSHDGAQELAQRRVPVAQGPDAGRAGHLAVRLEHLADGLAVPHFLEDPAGEEGRDLGVLVGRREEQIPQVTHGVVLNIMHVAQRAQDLRRERMLFEVVEIDPLKVQSADPFLV
ncbi:MAG TPA: hypothetical protein VG346_07245 [Acidimicrobiales bacterium]|nr:hypothetical protein [Acidimicrobiales bacterium]